MGIEKSFSHPPPPVWIIIYSPPFLVPRPKNHYTYKIFHKKLDNLNKDVVHLPGKHDIVLIMKEKIERYDLKSLRIELGMSQSEAARFAGISTRQWQRIEPKPVNLVDYVSFVKAIGGVFVVPETLYDVFERSGRVYSLKEFTTWEDLEKI